MASYCTRRLLEPPALKETSGTSYFEGGFWGLLLSRRLVGPITVKEATEASCFKGDFWGLLLSRRLSHHVETTDAHGSEIYLCASLPKKAAWQGD